MAIPRALGRLLLHLADGAGWSGSVLQLGRQTVLLTEREVRGEPAWRARFGPFADDQQFFGALGFTQVASSDLDAVGHATRDLDLNMPVPAELEARFDAVFDGGTVFCVFDAPAALRNVERMVKPGGRAIHTIASNGYVDEGLWMMSPRLVWDWYVGRGWTIEHFLLVEHSRRWPRERMRAFTYDPTAMAHQSVADFERGALLSVVVARRPAEVRDVIPYLRPVSRADRLPALLRTTTGTRVLRAVRPILPSRVLRVVPRRMPPSAGRW